MAKNLKIIDIKCKAHFISNTGSYSRPEILMYVDDITGDTPFILRDCGSWSHHGGPQLVSTNICIDIIGSRFVYEGEIHPCSGYEPTIDAETGTASFKLGAVILNTESREEIPVVLKFITYTTGNNSEINIFLDKLKEYNDKISNDKKEADSIMNLFK